MSLSPQFTKKNGVLLDNTDNFNGTDNYRVLFANGVYPEVKTWYKINTALGDGTPNYRAIAQKQGNLAIYMAIFWGDGTGTSSNVQNSSWEHTYSANGIYEIGYRGRFGSIGWGSTTYQSREKLIDVLQWEQTGLQTVNTFDVFRDCDNIVDFTATGYPRSTGSATLSGAGRLFDGCDLWNGDLSQWDVSLVTSFQETFRRCTVFNQDISGWDVGNNSRMSQMFYLATSFNQPIGGWDVGNNGNFANMFQSATSFNQDISGWDVTNGGGAVTLSSMFQNATSFNQDISGWDVSNCTNFTNMFNGATSFTQDLSNWDTSSGTSFIGCFANCPIGNLTNWDLSGVTSPTTGLGSIFQSNNTGANPDMSNWKFPSTPFSARDSLKFFRTWTGGDLTEKVVNPGTPEQYTAWDMSACTDMHEIFSDNTVFNGDCSNWNVGNVTDLSLAFAGTVFNQDIGSWNVANCTNMAAMFPSTFSQDLSSWNVGNVTSFSSFRFDGCGDTTGWNMSSCIFASSLNVGDYNYGTWTLSSITTIQMGVGQSLANRAKTLEGWGTNALTNTGATSVPIFSSGTIFSKTATVGVDGYDGQDAYNGYLKLIAPTPNANRTSGTNTSTATDKLIDSGATFTASVNAGDVVANTTAGTYSEVVSVDSDIQLTLADDIFTSTSQAYSVDGGCGWTITGITFT